MPSLKRVLGGLSLTAGVLIGSAGASAQEKVRIQSGDSALHQWAPILVKDLTDDVSSRRGYPTSFDFDGSWRLDNNPSNVRAYDLATTASTWWARTEAYLVLGYTFYWPLAGDGSAENLTRSIVLLLDAPSEDHPVGQFLAMAVQGEDGWSYATERDSRPAGLPLQTHDSEAADVDFVDFRGGRHPVVYSDAVSHDLTVEIDAADGRRPTLFDEEQVVNWQGVEPMLRRRGRSRSAYARGGRGRFMSLEFGLIFAPGEEAGLPAPAQQRAPGQLAHHWEVFSYQLRDIEPLWERRVVNETEPTVDREGRLIGRGARGASLPPWLDLVERRNRDGQLELHVEPSEMFFGGTRSFARVLQTVPDQPIRESSLGAGSELLRARSQLFAGPISD